MKKKGLIISTIVMVVVLIASLTTATYAWFNANAEVKVDNITVSVASASNISVGVAKSASSARNVATGYVNGQITYEDVADLSKGLGAFSSSGNKNGLGTAISWDWVISSIGGVSSGTARTGSGTDQDPYVYPLDSTYDPTHVLYNGEDQQGSPVGIGYAVFNKPTAQTPTVLYAPIGLRVEKAGMNYLYCDVTVTPDSNEFLGIVASLKLEIKSQANNATAASTYAYIGHPFAATSADGLLATAQTYVSVPGGSSEAPTPIVFRFIIAQDTSSTLAYGQSAPIYQFDIRMFLDGTDGSCIADATQYGAKIGLKFDAVSSETWTDMADSSKATYSPATATKNFTE